MWENNTQRQRTGNQLPRHFLVLFSPTFEDFLLLFFFNVPKCIFVTACAWVGCRLDNFTHICTQIQHTHECVGVPDIYDGTLIFMTFVCPFKCPPPDSDSDSHYAGDMNGGPLQCAYLKRPQKDNQVQGLINLLNLVINVGDAALKVLYIFKGRLGTGKWRSFIYKKLIVCNRNNLLCKCSIISTAA